MQVSIIMVNYNTLKLTKNAINSILEKVKGIEYEIILIDNNSEDGSKEYFTELHNHGKIRLVISQENLGFGRANNIGFDLAKGKYIFLLNTDTILINNAIKILYEYLEKNKEVGICGGNLFYEDLEPAHSFGKKLPSLRTDLKEVFFISALSKMITGKREDFNYTNEEKEVGYITGADMMIRKEALKSSGYFDKDFFMYYEEVELTNRIKKCGYKVMSVPNAKIVHLESKSFTYKEHRARMMYESRYKYYSKVYGENSLCKSYLVQNLILFTRALFKFDTDFLKMIKINKKEYKNYKLEEGK